MIPEVRDAPSLSQLIERARSRDATDIHLVADERPWLRVDGDVVRLDDWPACTFEGLAALAEDVVPEEKQPELATDREVDFGYSASGSRFRVTAFRERRGLALAFRVLPGTPPPLAELGLPGDLARVVYAPSGLCLFAGHAGSGKTTTLASVLQQFCTHRTARVLTVEDPIEYRLEPRKAFVSQREVGRHCASFARGVQEALETSPEVLAIGELRDVETIRLALQAAVTGVLVFATVHAYDSSRTIGRIVDAFPPEERVAARDLLAASVRMIVAQTLLRKSAGHGRVPAVEVAFGSQALATLIRDGKDHEIETILESSRSRGMRKLDDALVELVRQGTVAADEVLPRAVHRDRVEARIAADQRARR